ncbi:hypothetical protein RND71_017191 [Anisodus tanguticus]|uniref:Cytochrome P450 n=1 Tax=Anisodus tanguticus TaxID=243964 RepID=A0AAE1S203_9SOLA|nr:hypothetical protein RND71_017191 [Anisodus tanguticus]
MEASFHWLCIVTFSYVLLLFAQKAFVHLWWTPKRIQKHFRKQGITGPKYQFLFGNLKEIAGFTTTSWPSSFISHDILPRVLPFYHHWKKIYGSTFVIWFGPTARVTISDPALIRDIFVLKSDRFEKNESPALVKKLEGDGLLSLKGEKWAHHRKIITPTFYIENLKLMIPMMGKSMTDMLDKWSKMSNTSGKVEIEVSEMFSTLAEDVITRIVFGSSYQDGRAIFELQAQQMVYATEAYQKVLSDECPNDLLEVMIKATSHEYRNSSNITVNDIVEECKTIFFAGKHTTSNLLTWTTILLAMHPQWQEQAREEVLRVCGAREPPSKDDLAKLKTLGMIINESVRLYPPAVAAIRRAKIDTQLGDFTLPQGTELLIPIIAIHHDQTLWGQDANEFNPARFSRGVAQAAKHPMAFMPFGLGARRCVGQNLAVVQAKLAIAMILQRFSFDLSPSYQHAPTILMLLCPQHGAPIIFQKL